MPSVCGYVKCHIFTQTYTSFIYEDIFIKFAENVVENMSVKYFHHFQKENDHHNQLFKIIKTF